MTSNAMLEQLVHSPRLGLYVDQLQDVLADERRRREAFYEEMDESQKQEFINGEVIMHSPVKFKHERASTLFCRIAGAYVDKHGLGLVTHEKILICLTRNDYEPDVCFFSKEKAQKFEPDQMKFPAPDFIAEVLSDSTEANDRGVKFDDYAAHGVREYWLIDPDNRIVEQYDLADDAYALRLKLNGGMLQSRVIEGFEIPLPAIFDEAENLAALAAVLGTSAR
jgi:Uma2 family endonuclease